MTTTDPRAARERNRAMWEAGDWDVVAPQIEAAGPRLLDRLGELDDLRLLDVGTGSGGSIAIPAALRGADVVGSDIADAWFVAARRRAAEAGAEVRWVVGDAVELPSTTASSTSSHRRSGTCSRPTTTPPRASSFASAVPAGASDCAAGRPSRTSRASS
jgi:SAM-dependent methyltransferase